jgi:hypothetical protein
MQETNQVRLRISYEGTEYECRPDMRTLMMVEERVLLHKLASSITRGFDEVPMTHLIWVMYCLLYCAGARVTADDVREALLANKLDAGVVIDVAKWIVAEVYGPAPRPDEEDDEAPKT